MTIHIAYEKKQVIHGLRYHFLTRPEIKMLVIFVNVFAILSAILAIFKIIQPISFMVFSVLWLVLMLVIWRILPATIYRRSQTFKDEFSMDINHNNVELHSERGSQVWPWERFSSFVESTYFFHLYFSTRAFFIIPKDSFEGLTDLQEARRLFKEKIKNG